MSIFSDISSVVLDVASLILPRTCLACGTPLQENESGVCLVCRCNAPLTGFAQQSENSIKWLFENTLPIEHAAAMFWFERDSEWRRIIHSFKYHGRWYFAQKMGEWFGEELRKSGNFADVDVIVPVPLHFRRRLMRGYNQSEQLALGIGRKLGVRCDFDAVRRRLYNDSQTSKTRTERWDNVDAIFDVRSAKRLRGRHILLVDDVLTTGATINSCASAIVRACEGEVRISVASLAASTLLRQVI